MKTAVKSVSTVHNGAKALFFLLLLLSLLVVFAGRSFPSQDGPLHLYYADVTRNLIQSTGVYDNGYAIRYYLTPYITQTYLLIGLESFFQPLVAEKLLVSLYVIAFCFGFRYVVRSLAPENDSLSIFAFLFVFNYPIYKGFYNFCLGTVVALWVIGFWIRYSGSLTPKRSCVFAGLMLLAALSHPVPLGFCLMFLTLHTALRVLWDTESADTWLGWKLALQNIRQSIRKNLRPLVHVAISTLTLIWVLEFTDRGDFQGGALEFADRLREFFLMYIIFPLRTRFWRWSAMLTVAAAAFTTTAWFWRQRRALRERVQIGQVSLVLMSLACLTIAMIAPARVSGGTLIAPRFALFGFIVFVAAGICVPFSRRTKTVVGALVLPVLLGILVTLGDLNRRVLAQEGSILDVSPVASEAYVAWLPKNATGSEGDLNWAPRRHLGAHYARRSKAVLVGFDLLDAPYTNLSPRLQHACMYGITETCLLSSWSNSTRRPDLDVLVSDLDAQEIATLYGLDRRVSVDSVRIFIRSNPSARSPRPIGRPWAGHAR